MDAAIFKKLHPSEYLKRFLDGPGVRSDGRAPTAARRQTITTSSIATAVGSSMVKLGRTTAVAGVTASLAPPVPTASDLSAGTLTITVHVPPLAGGPTSGSSGATGSARDADVAALAAFVRENTLPFIDLPALCVEASLLVWHLSLSLYILDHDGNTFDAALLAAVAALHDTRLPKARLIDDLPASDPDFDEDDDSGILAVVSDDRPVRLSIPDFALSATFAVFDTHFLLDPSREEELVAHARITIVLRANGELRAVQKPGGPAVSVADIAACYATAQKHVAGMVVALKEQEESQAV